VQQLLSLYIRKKLELQVEVGRGGEGEENLLKVQDISKGREKKKAKRKKKNWFSSLMFIAPRER